ncbi:MAG: hypothetical protein HY978_00160 [Candidatus Liptonbacteria bacterium]|nr:hypothetical protein [Candidatus Liptonbacteria bacterium]
MHKIFLDKSETVVSAVEKIMAAPGEDIVLVLPKGTTWAESINNFKVLKREAEAVQKQVRIESVDEAVIALARASSLEAIHPFLHRTGQSLSDIVSAPSDDRRHLEASQHLHLHHRRPDVVLDPDQPGPSRREPTPRRRAGVGRALGKIILSLAILAGVAFLLAIAVDRVWGWGEVRITLQKVPWFYEGTLTADRAASGVHTEPPEFPAAVFTQTKNITQSFPASGEAVVSEKAAGRIVVYNAFSSEPQVLVATTRFATSDGKIFRLTDRVLVPGAKVKDSQITPASTEVNVTADQPGAEYNRNAQEKLTIPGFRGTPKFQGFYGEILETSGGFVGQKKVPTDQDVAAAKDKTVEILKKSLVTSLTYAKPQGFLVPEGAATTTVTKLNVLSGTDAKGNFSVLAEGTLTAIGFRSSDQQSLLEALANADSTLPGNLPQLKAKDFKFDYLKLDPDYPRGRLVLRVKVNATLVPAVAIEDLPSRFAGKSVAEARSLLTAMPGLSGGKVSVWPVWQDRLPDQADRLKIVVE